MFLHKIKKTFRFYFYIRMTQTFFYDKTTNWLHSGGKPTLAPPGGVGKLLFNKIMDYAKRDLIYQIDFKTKVEETYESFLQKCVKIALYMRNEGLKPGDIISMCSYNNMNNVAVLVAALFNGIILASTDPLISSTDSKYLLDIVEPKLMLVCEKSFIVSRKAIEGKNIKIVTLYIHEFHDNVPDILENYTEKDIKSFIPYYAVNNNETINIQFSSGTSGMPKAACLNHHKLLGDVSNDLPLGTRYITFITLYWGTNVSIALTQLVTGCIRINVGQVSPEHAWDYIHKAHCIMVYWSHYYCMQSLPYLQQPMPDLKIMWIAGGLFPLQFQTQLKQFVSEVKMIRTYGLTEIGTVTINNGECAPDSAGFIHSRDIIVKIVDIDTDQAVGLNLVGEIRVKGKNQLSGYYKRNSNDIWDAEGFYKTGDLGYLDDKYELYVVDRIKEMFKSRAYHVIPAKIERVLGAHPAVRQAFVIPVPHLLDENHAKGLVVLKHNYTIDVNELVKYTNERIEDPRDHICAGIQFIREADIPVTATNKVNRRLLRQTFAN